MTVICISGKKRVGKDTVSDILVKRYGFAKIALADPLKELCSAVFRLELDYFNNQNLKEKELKPYIELDYSHLDKIRAYVEDKWGFVISYNDREVLEESYNTLLKTPRQIMQVIGTLIRTCVRDDVFIFLTYEKLKTLAKDVVITDARMHNEREFFKSAGATLILVKRETTEEDSHSSENDLGSEDDYNIVIDNNFSLQSLENDVSYWYSLSKTNLTYYKRFDYEKK